ncbi:MAG: CBS domain-containing protein [archaeon]|jgi:predicted transcriptional regulator|nr:CBS domain-containing protein [archaeon]
MLPDLSEIKLLRKRQNLTQSGLASLSGVSQSLIAKLEAGKIIPSYDKAKRLFDILEKIHEEKTPRAKDAMTKKVLHVNESDSIKSAVKTLEKNGLSQLPVLKNGQNVGLITERGMLAKINAGADLQKDKVSDVMDEACPTIQESTPLQVVSQLLNYSPAVLVKKRGKINGILTKSDLLKAMLKK